jgi:hypothetical protein
VTAPTSTTAPRLRARVSTGSTAPARVDLAAVHGARRQLAAVAAGHGLLLHTEDLGRASGDVVGVLRRAVEARLILAYASGGPVTHLDSPARPDTSHLLGDAAATDRPVSPVDLVEELIRAWPAGSVRTNLLAPMWRAAKFAQARRMRPDRIPPAAPLLCGRPGGEDREVPGGGPRRYDPAAHVLRLDPANHEQAYCWVNPLLLDVTQQEPAALPELCEQLDPEHEPGRLILLLRGPGHLAGPALAAGAAALRRSGRTVVWLVVADSERPEQLAPLVAGAATGVCLGGPGPDDDGTGGWLRDRSAQLATALLS